jgi:hypothetical protein
LASSLPAMSHATRMASRQAAVYVSRFRCGVAPAQREVRQAGRDGGFDEAAPRCEIGDVVLVDLRRDDHQRAPVDLRRGLVVLDQLEQLGAVYDVPWRDPEVAADGEGPRVDLRRHAAVVTQVVRAVPRAGEQALAPGLDSLRHRVGVGRQEVRRRQRLGEQRHGEMGASAALGVELDLVDDPVRRVALDEVRLHEATEHRVLLPHRVVEATVAAGGGDIAASDGHAQQLGERAHRGGGCGARFDGDALAEPCQRGDDLFACQPDERVGAEDRWIVTVERGLRCLLCLPCLLRTHRGSRLHAWSGDSSGWWPHSLIRS